MEIKLYSPTHLREANSLYPDRVRDPAWYRDLWTEDEINACKALETAAFCQTPSVSYLEGRFPGFMEDRAYRSDLEIPWLSRLIEAERPAAIRSIGCGFGRKEMYLARKYPQVRFYCDDSATYG